MTRVTSEKKAWLLSRDIYVMRTEPHGWEVRRRLSDYKWLSQRLRREFPRVNLPHFNGKGKDDIDSYMNYLLTESEVLVSRFLIYFLSTTNYEKFYAKKEKEYDEKNRELWNAGSNSLRNKQPTQEAKNKILEPAVVSDPDVLNHFFLEEVSSLLSSNPKHHQKYELLTKDQEGA